MAESVTHHSCADQSRSTGADWSCVRPGDAARSVGPMTTRKQTVGGSLPSASWIRPWTQLVEIAWSAPVVISYRTARIMTGGWPPSARDRREYTRMVHEKAEAFGQAALAAMTTPSKDIAKAVGYTLAPIHRRVVANRRRLSGA